jgi:glutamate decarboxylase
MGPFELVYDGDMTHGIPAVSWKIKKGTDPGFSLFDRLRVRGWQVPAYTLPANCQDQAI